MKFLIDTNILISLEPTSDTSIEPGARDAAEVARLIQQSANRIVVHPHVFADIARDGNQQRRAHREHVLKKYPLLDGAPQITTADEGVIGVAAQGSNDWVDNHLLVAVARDAVDYLITQDHAIHTRAARGSARDLRSGSDRRRRAHDVARVVPDDADAATGGPQHQAART